MFRTITKFAVGAVVLGAMTDARGAVVTEYFNGYGTAEVSLAGMNGGSGWTAPWAGDITPHFGPTAAFAAYNLNYTASGYSNVGNGSALSDGAAVMGGGNAGNTATRTLRTGGTTLDTGLDGTIWVSALVNSGTVASSDMLVWMDRPDVTNSFVSIRGLTAKLRYNAVDSSGPAAEYAISTTYLLLAKVVINASGTNDTLDLWVNPNLSGGEAGLGAPKLSGANNANVFGNAFSGVGVSFAGYGKIDSIRISNETTAFNDVTMVPEPTLMGISMGLGCWGLGMRRRRV